MIVRYKLPAAVDKEQSNAQVHASLATVNNYIRCIQARSTKAMCSCVAGAQAYIGDTQGVPNTQQLQALMDKAMAKQWLQDVLQLRQSFSDDFQISMQQQALGPHQQIIRVARDLRNSSATRKERIQQALCGQIRKAKANSQDISAIQGVQLMKGCFL